MSHRNLNFYNGSTGFHLGGVRKNGSITNANFFDMLTNVWLEVEAVNSVQNGLLLAASMHQLFDNFQILVNPEVSKLLYLR